MRIVSHQRTRPLTLMRMRISKGACKAALLAYINRTLYAQGPEQNKPSKTLRQACFLHGGPLPIVDRERQYDRMDPILFGFLITAVLAVIFLIIVNIYLYIEYNRVHKRKDSSTQTIRKQHSYSEYSHHRQTILSRKKDSNILRQGH